MGRALAPLVDRFGRVADDLRVSLTDRCNFRCTYCMPAEGLAWLPRSELLTFEELARLLGIFVGLGVRSLKVTGGEPTVRADLPNLIRMFRRAGPELDISITTNGLLLDRLAGPLAEAGVDRATDSCDSLLRRRLADGASGGVGASASVAEAFCDTSNRLRLTAEGACRSCLFAMDETDLRSPLRGGASDEALAGLIRDGVWAKWSGHRINHPDFVQPERSMSMIGG